MSHGRVNNRVMAVMAALRSQMKSEPDHLLLLLWARTVKAKRGRLDAGLKGNSILSFSTN